MSVFGCWKRWPGAGGRRGSWKRSFHASIAPAERNGRAVVLSRPQTFMNASGEAVGALVKFYRLPLDRLVVVVDDADLPLGEIRLRGSGSSGGHHGIESIEQHAGSREFARLRIGIGRTADKPARDNRPCAGAVHGGGVGGGGQSFNGGSRAGGMLVGRRN